MKFSKKNSALICLGERRQVLNTPIYISFWVRLWSRELRVHNYSASAYHHQPPWLKSVSHFTQITPTTLSLLSFLHILFAWFFGAMNKALSPHMQAGIEHSSIYDLKEKWKVVDDEAPRQHKQKLRKTNVEAKKSTVIVVEWKQKDTKPPSTILPPNNPHQQHHHRKRHQNHQA